MLPYFSNTPTELMLLCTQPIPSSDHFPTLLQEAYQFEKTMILSNSYFQCEKLLQRIEILLLDDFFNRVDENSA
jgi:hypothetical protein